MPAPTQVQIQAPVLIVPAAHPTTLQLHRGFPTPASPASDPTAPQILGHVWEDRPQRFPRGFGAATPFRIALLPPVPSQREEMVLWLGAAYRGATPRGARGSRTRCRGRRRRGTPGSRPAVPQSCRAKRTQLASTARPCHTSVPSAAPSAGLLPALKENSHHVNHH